MAINIKMRDITAKLSSFPAPFVCVVLTVLFVGVVGVGLKVVVGRCVVLKVLVVSGGCVVLHPCRTHPTCVLINQFIKGYMPLRPNHA